jgi:hypothetical protein
MAMMQEGSPAASLMMLPRRICRGVQSGETATVLPKIHTQNGDLRWPAPC